MKVTLIHILYNCFIIYVLCWNHNLNISTSKMLVCVLFFFKQVKGFPLKFYVWSFLSCNIYS